MYKKNQSLYRIEMVELHFLPKINYQISLGFKNDNRKNCTQVEKPWYQKYINEIEKF